MKFGISIFATDYSMHPAELAREIEMRGFESVWLPEHTHIPVNTKSPFPGGGKIPKQYWHTHDLFVALSFAAAATTRLKIASGICLMVEHDPIVTAKKIASLDTLSEGRFLFGIGGGWNAEEMADHGTEFKKRWRILRERVLAMKEIWANDEAEFHGEFVDFDKILSYPKPVQKPHPPIFMGGFGPRTFDRVVEFSDGWIPIGLPPADMGGHIRELLTKAETAGRSPSEISVTYITRPHVSKKDIETLTEAGVERIVFSTPVGTRSVVLPALDKHAALADIVR